MLLAPTRRDGEITRALLEGAGSICIVHEAAGALARALDESTGPVVLTDAALHDPTINELIDALHRQPTWSDIPVILLSRSEMPTPMALKVLDSLGNVTLLDRPVSRRALISAIQTAIRARDRQYVIRDQIRSLAAAEAAEREAARRKDEFLATLAHELRNPLAPLRTGLQLLKAPGIDAHAVARVRGMMDRQMTQLVHLIDDLLDVSRISRGKIVLRLERLRLRAVIEAAVESVRPAIEAAQHELVVEWPVEDIWVNGDMARLSQVVSNLLSNAAKYTPNGGRITVRSTTTGGAAQIEVLDTGVGIPPDVHDELFEIFTQINQTLDRSQGGLGIGLSIVRNLMELHGGTVSVSSEGLGHGSTFTVRMPALTTPTRAAVPSPDTASRQDSRAGGAALRILVIDDNRDGADSLAMLLRLDGHEARVEYSAASGLRAEREFRPDAVFCDIGLPGMSGYEIAQQIASVRKASDPVLIAVTGWGQDSDKQRAQEAGFAFHLTKPVAPEDLARVLGRIAPPLTATRRREEPLSAPHPR